MLSATTHSGIVNPERGRRPAGRSSRFRLQPVDPPWRRTYNISDSRDLLCDGRNVCVWCDTTRITITLCFDGHLEESSIETGCTALLRSPRGASRTEREFLRLCSNLFTSPPKHKKHPHPYAKNHEPTLSVE